MDETKATLAAAVAGGYILGRSKKGRLALTSVAFLLGRRFNADPQQLVAEGVQRLRKVPQVSELEQQVKTEGLDVARKALSSVVGRGLKSVTGGLSSRLPGADIAGKSRGGDTNEEEAEERDEPDEPDDSRERAPRRRRRDTGDSGGRAASKPSRTSTKKRTSGGAAERTAPAKKSAKTASKRTAPAKRTASAPAKKAASTRARPTRSGSRSSGRR